MNLREVIQRFNTQEDCVKHLEYLRWGDKPVCPYCQKTNTYPMPKELRHHCNDCRKSFSVTVGTVFHRTHMKLQDWFLVMSLMVNAKKGLSAYQIARDFGLRRETVWSMMNRIRKAMGNNAIETKLFESIVEIDETYVGGKPKRDKDNKRGRGTKKTPVVGIVDRDTKQVKAQVMLPNNEGKKLTGKQLLSIIETAVKENTVVMTDEFTGYNILDKDLRYFRKVINHSIGEYVDGDTHTNSIESFWAILKRGVYGSYHQISVKYLQYYVNEFMFRYNNREMGFDILLSRCI